MQRLLAICTLAIAMLASLASGVDTTTTEETSFSGSYHCCINGAYYTCDSAQAAENCMYNDLSGCSRDTFKDDECE